MAEQEQVSNNSEAMVNEWNSAMDVVKVKLDIDNLPTENLLKFMTLDSNTAEKLEKVVDFHHIQEAAGKPIPLEDMENIRTLAQDFSIRESVSPDDTFAFVGRAISEGEIEGSDLKNIRFEDFRTAYDEGDVAMLGEFARQEPEILPEDLQAVADMIQKHGGILTLTTPTQEELVIINDFAENILNTYNNHAPKEEIVGYVCEAFDNAKGEMTMNELTEVTPEEFIYTFYNEQAPALVENTKELTLSQSIDENYTILASVQVLNDEIVVMENKNQDTFATMSRSTLEGADQSWGYSHFSTDKQEIQDIFEDNTMTLIEEMADLSQKENLLELLNTELEILGNIPEHPKAQENVIPEVLYDSKEKAIKEQNFPLYEQSQQANQECASFIAGELRSTPVSIDVSVAEEIISSAYALYGEERTNMVIAASIENYQETLAEDRMYETNPYIDMHSLVSDDNFNWASGIAVPDYSGLDMYDLYINSGSNLDELATAVQNLEQAQVLESDKNMVYQAGDFYLAVHDEGEYGLATLVDSNFSVVTQEIYSDITNTTEIVEAFCEKYQFEGMESLQNGTAERFDTLEYYRLSDQARDKKGQSYELETSFLENKDNAFAVFQHKVTSDNYAVDLPKLEEMGKEVNKSDYICVHSGFLDSIVEQEYIDETNSKEEFMQLFEGNFLSDTQNDEELMESCGDFGIGDVVALKIDGEVSYHFMTELNFREGKHFGMEEVEFTEIPVQISVKEQEKTPFISQENGKNIEILGTKEELTQIHNAMNRDLYPSELDSINTLINNALEFNSEHSREEYVEFMATALNVPLISTEDLHLLNPMELSQAIHFDEPKQLQGYIDFRKEYMAELPEVLANERVHELKYSQSVTEAEELLEVQAYFSETMPTSDLMAINDTIHSVTFDKDESAKESVVALIVEAVEKGEIQPKDLQQIPLNDLDNALMQPTTASLMALVEESQQIQNATINHEPQALENIQKLLEVELNQGDLEKINTLCEKVTMVSPDIYQSEVANFLADGLNHKLVSVADLDYLNPTELANLVDFQRPKDMQPVIESNKIQEEVVLRENNPERQQDVFEAGAFTQPLETQRIFEEMRESPQLVETLKETMATVNTSSEEISAPEQLSEMEMENQWFEENTMTAFRCDENLIASYMPTADMGVMLELLDSNLEVTHWQEYPYTTIQEAITQSCEELSFSGSEAIQNGTAEVVDLELLQLEKNAPRQVNDHYFINESKVVGDTEVALGQSNDGNIFATWERNIPADESKGIEDNWNFGHYFMNDDGNGKEKAQEDFQQRVDKHTPEQEKQKEKPEKQEEKAENKKEKPEQSKAKKEKQVEKEKKQIKLPKIKKKKSHDER